MATVTEPVGRVEEKLAPGWASKEALTDTVGTGPDGLGEGASGQRWHQVHVGKVESDRIVECWLGICSLPPENFRASAETTTTKGEASGLGAGFAPVAPDLTPR